MKKKMLGAILFSIDAVLINLAYIASFYIRFDGNFTGANASQYIPIYFENFITFTLIKLIIFYVFGMYKNLWKYASIGELFQIVGTSFVANTGIITYMVLTQQMLPRSIYLLALLTFMK